MQERNLVGFAALSTVRTHGRHWPVVKCVAHTLEISNVWWKQSLSVNCPVSGSVKWLPTFSECFFSFKTTEIFT